MWKWLQSVGFVKILIGEWVTVEHKGRQNGRQVMSNLMRNSLTVLYEPHIAEY